MNATIHGSIHTIYGSIYTTHGSIYTGVAMLAAVPLTGIRSLAVQHQFARVPRRV